MAHEIEIDLNTKFVLHKDVSVDVKKNGSKLGTILISKGNIEWVPAGHSAIKYRFTWTQFAKLMEEGKETRIK